MVTMRKLKGLGVPRRVGSEAFQGLKPEVREELLAELAALDQNFREILNRIDDQIVLGIVAFDYSDVRLEGIGLDSIELFDFVEDGDNLKLQVRQAFAAGTHSIDFTLDAVNGYDQSITLSADCSLTGISNITGPAPFSLRAACGVNTLNLPTADFEGPTLDFTGTVGLTFKDFGTGKLVVMGGDW